MCLVACRKVTWRFECTLSIHCMLSVDRYNVQVNSKTWTIPDIENNLVSLLLEEQLNGVSDCDFFNERNFNAAIFFNWLLFCLILPLHLVTLIFFFFLFFFPTPTESWQWKSERCEKLSVRTVLPVIFVIVFVYPANVFWDRKESWRQHLINVTEYNNIVLCARDSHCHEQKFLYAVIVQNSLLLFISIYLYTLRKRNTIRYDSVVWKEWGFHGFIFCCLC